MAPIEPRLHDSAGSSQASLLLYCCLGLHQPDAMEIVRDLQARIEVKKEVMEDIEEE
jgi:hypothetical protein